MLFSIKDVKTGIFGAPRVAESLEDFIRSLKVVFEFDKNSLMFKFPADFHIYKVGDFDITNGFVFSQEPEYISNLVEIVPQTNVELTNVDMEKIQKLISDFNSNVEILSKDIVNINQRIGSIDVTNKELSGRILNLERRTLWQSMKNSLSFKKS